MKRIIFILCALGIIVIVCFLVKSFLIGETTPVDRITINNVTVQKSQVKIQGDFVLDSSLAFKDYKYRIDGSDLYIIVYQVLVSSIYKYGNVDITIDNLHTNIDCVYLEDRKYTKLIWHIE